MTEETDKENKSVKDILYDLHHKIEEIKEEKKDGGKKKKFWIPFKAKVGRVGLRKGFTTIMKVNGNKAITFERDQIVESTVMMDGIPRVVEPGDLLSYKGRPFVIIPAWSTKAASSSELQDGKAFNADKHHDKSIELKTHTKGSALLLNRMKSEVISAKKQVKGMTVILVILVIAVVGYLGYQQGWFK